MKIFLAFIFILISLAGILRPPNSSCEGFHSPTNTVSDKKYSTIAAISSDEQKDCCGSHRHGETGHQCHFGHCSFTLVPYINSVSIFELCKFLPTSLYFALSEFKSNLFRPPITNS